MLTSSASIAIIGCGARGGALSRALVQRGFVLRAFDKRLLDETQRAAMLQHIQRAGAEPAASLQAALAGAKLVLLAVPEDATAALRASIAAQLLPGQQLLDSRADYATLQQWFGLDTLIAPLPTHDRPQLLRGELP